MIKEYRIERNQLYEQVWTKPIVAIAKEYEVSDKAIAKICEKLKVPVPGVGYWQKLEAGETLERKKLPEIPPDSPTEHTIRKSVPEYKFEISEEVNALIESEKDPANKILVPEKKRLTHFLIRGTEQSLEKSYRYPQLLSSRKKDDILRVSVSPNEKGRVFRILNTIIFELEKRGYRVYIDRSLLCVKMFGVDIRFSLNEKMKQVRLKTESHYARQYEYIPSGILALRIEGYFSYHHLTRNFLDNKSSKVENRLNEFIIALLITSQADIAKEKHWEEIRKISREEERKRNEILEAIKNEEKKISELEKNIELFHKAKMIREFVDALRVRNTKLMLSDTERKEQEDYINWALEQADRMDPLVKSTEP